MLRFNMNHIQIIGKFSVNKVGDSIQIEVNSGNDQNTIYIQLSEKEFANLFVDKQAIGRVIVPESFTKNK